MKRKWHLDLALPENVFDLNWPRDSNQSLLALFKHLDSSNQAVVSMLPSGISPAAAAVAASMYFLPGIGKPPSPHCRIALFPGLHFLRHLKQLKFSPSHILETTKRARSMGRGSAQVSKPIERLQRRVRKDPTDQDPIYFHWLWRCRRVWTRYTLLESEDLLPRGYLGSGDDFFAVLDIVESDRVDRVSSSAGPFDLLIYCPYYHSRSLDGDEDDARRINNIVTKFDADRKLIVARSPFDYWSKRVENITRSPGIAFLSTKPSIPGTSAIKINLVIQILTIEDAFDLNQEIKALRKRNVIDPRFLSDARAALRYILIGLDPRRDTQMFEDSLAKISELGELAGWPSHSNGGRIIQQILEKVRSGSFKTKKDYLEEAGLSERHEVWVTKDLDRRTVTDLRSELAANFHIRLADRWMVAGARTPGTSAVLTRIDREGDLDAVAYLESGDSIVLSTWEAVVRAETIEVAWSRSQQWRDAASSRLSAQKLNVGEYVDPVLELADHLITMISNLVASRSVNPDMLRSTTPEESWWDAHVSSADDDTMSARGSLLSPNEGGVPCLELHLTGNTGIFLRRNSELQVLRSRGTNEDEFESVSAADIQEGDQVLIFKDMERSSIFDILLDQLGRSAEYGADAIQVRLWKEKLRDAFIKSRKSWKEIQEFFSTKNVAVDVITIRSWIAGPTMAPLHQTNLQILVNFLQVSGIDLETLYVSVRKLRSVARLMGRALNTVILSKNLEDIDPKIRSTIENAGIDVEELLGAVEIRTVTGISDGSVEVSAAYVGKLFRRNG